MTMVNRKEFAGGEFGHEPFKECVQLRTSLKSSLMCIETCPSKVFDLY